MLKRALGPMGAPVVGGILALVIIFSSIGVVQTGHVGIFMTLGMVSDTVKEEGFYLKIPFIQSVKQMDVRTRKIEWIKNEETITAMSKDMLDIYIQAVVTYHPIADKGATIYKTMGMDFSDNIVGPLTVNAIKTYIGKYSVSDVLQNREKITEDMNKDLKVQLAQYHIVLEFVSLVNIDFRPGLKAAIEQREIAEKMVETQKYTLEKQALEAQQQVKKAEADKQARILSAEAEEIFNRKVSGSLTEMLLKYKALQSQEKAIEKWNGNYPQVVAGGQSIPMIQLPQQPQK
jgi:regulator of protease activity HflC (stomatin/prohibitin superfamily)